ncbi:MAG: ABC transporter permease [Elusimicrobiota bacterium]
MVRNIFSIAKYTFYENLRKKNFIILFLYIAVVLGSGTLFSMLSPAQEIRVIMDLGTAAIEMFAFLSCAFISVRIVLQEMNDKTVYLILSRPVTRANYLLGRFSGILSIMFTYILIMIASLTIMLLSKGWLWDTLIIGIGLSIFLKIIIVASFSILLSLVSTSPASSFVSIFFLWALGHFTTELKYLSSQLKHNGFNFSFLLQLFYYILPNFSKMNYKDFFHIKDVFSVDMLCAGLYAVGYTIAVLLLCTIIFNRKEL